MQFKMRLGREAARRNYFATSFYTNISLFVVTCVCLKRLPLDSVRLLFRDVKHRHKLGKSETDALRLDAALTSGLNTVY